MNVRPSGQLSVKHLGKKEIMCVYVCMKIITCLFSSLFKLSFLQKNALINYHFSTLQLVIPMVTKQYYISPSSSLYFFKYWYKYFYLLGHSILIVVTIDMLWQFFLSQVNSPYDGIWDHLPHQWKPSYCEHKSV